MPHEPVTSRLKSIQRASLETGRRTADNENRLCPSVAFLAAHRFPKVLLSRATHHASINGTTAASELLAHGRISEDAYYRTLAEELGARFVEPEELIQALTEAHAPVISPVSRLAAWCRLHDDSVMMLVAPDPGSGLIGSREFAMTFAAERPIAITTHSALRGALIERAQRSLAKGASERLATETPEHSAKFGAGSWHGFVLGAGLIATAAGLVLAPGATFLVLQGLVSLFFLAVVILRFAAALSSSHAPLTPLARYSNAERPVYSVVVALHHEAPIVPDLVIALEKLHWPKSKLEIKLVCEEGDEETLDALAALRLDRRFEIITTPQFGPQTKPKALNYALPFCTGNLITLYDAEDRPHPEQLEEAWQAFHAADDKLGALQAPLMIANPRRNLLTALFHLEFAALFGGILRFLARNSLPIPLGGTSTHFRRAAIEETGAWDAYNVTEDADLGFRLWRSGFRIGILSRPTLEDAPDRLSVWLRQRTRWIKGWAQTWIVRTRRIRFEPAPGRLAGAAVMHTLLAGTVVSTLFYPLTLLTLAVSGVLAATGQISPVIDYLFAVTWANIMLSFGTYVVLCTTTIDRSMHWRAVMALPAIPLYWLMGSIAGWRAVIQYFRDPFLWEKTPHEPHDPDGAFHHP